MPKPSACHQLLTTLETRWSGRARLHTATCSMTHKTPMERPGTLGRALLSALACGGISTHRPPAHNELHYPIHRIPLTRTLRCALTSSIISPPDAAYGILLRSPLMPPPPSQIPPLPRAPPSGGLLPSATPPTVGCGLVRRHHRCWGKVSAHNASRQSGTRESSTTWSNEPRCSCVSYQLAQSLQKVSYGFVSQPFLGARTPR